MTDRSIESDASDARIVLSLLEFHVAFGCNLTCESCAHYSNHAHAGNIRAGRAGAADRAVEPEDRSAEIPAAGRELLPNGKIESRYDLFDG
jgi:hypothetical protein